MIAIYFWIGVVFSVVILLIGIATTVESFSSYSSTKERRENARWALICFTSMLLMPVIWAPVLLGALGIFLRVLVRQAEVSPSQIRREVLRNRIQRSERELGMRRYDH